MIHAGRLNWRRNAVLALILLAVAGLLPVLSAPGRARAATQPDTSLTIGGPDCAIEAGQAYCWEFGSALPAAVDTRGVLAGKTLTQISAAFGYACALDTAGAAYCWGSNDHGRLGFGVLASSDVPVRVDTRGVLAGKKLVQISAGQLAACALDSAGHAYCWGDNTFGELGDGGTAGSNVPVAVTTGGVLAGKTLTQIGTGFATSCALDSSGAAYCWGYNFHGELGNNSHRDSSVPVAVDAGGALAGKTITQLSVGEETSCVVSDVGAVYCWGAGFGAVPVAFGPSPPTGVTATSGKRAVRVSWKAPVMLGRVTGYTAIARPGEEICITSTTACTIPGLTNDITYSVTVIARTPTVNSVASAPVFVTPGSRVSFTSNPYATAAFGTAFRFTVRASASRSPAPKITIRGILPPGVTFTRHANGTAVLAGTPDGTAVGLYPLTFTAITTGAGRATQPFTLAVTKAPALRRFPSVIVVKDLHQVMVPVKAVGYPVPQLLGSGQLPPELGIADLGNGNGFIGGQVDRFVAGSFRFTVIAASTSGEATRAITVLVPESPGITSRNSIKVAIGFTFTFHVTATGFPPPAVTETGRLPRGVTFNAAKATLSGIPRSGTRGTYRITFTAKNMAGTITQHFTLTVT